MLTAPLSENLSDLNTLRLRFRGCLLGGAVGDALGGPVEFLSFPEITARFGAQGIIDYEAAWGGKGKITDDTQMTLFTAEGLLRGWVRGAMRGIAPAFTGTTAHAYQRWLLTQGEHNRHGLLKGFSLSGWLIQQQALYSARAPGVTCLSALREMKRFGEPASNHSKGCGGVMRVAPVGLFYARNQETDAVRQAFDMGCRLAALTHGHPTGWLTGGVLAVLVFHLAQGETLHAAADSAIALLKTQPAHEETLHAIELAQQLAQTPTPSHEAIAKLGEGWVAEEALAIAVYCALAARSFEHGVLMAVNHSGDSDSTGAIAGNLLGAMYGVTAIRTAWLENLELNSVIQEIADDLLEYKAWEISDYTLTPFTQALLKKYPGD